MTAPTKEAIRDTLDRIRDHGYDLRLDKGK